MARMPAIAPTTIDRRVVFQIVESTTEEAERVYFRSEHAVLAEARAVIWTDGDELVVSHPNGKQTRYPGEWIIDERIPGRFSKALKLVIGFHD